MKTLLISCVMAPGLFMAAAAQQAAPPAQPRPANPPQTAKPSPPAGQPAPQPARPTTPPAPQPGTAQPTTTPPPVRRAPAAAPATGRGGIAITVTTPGGATLPNIAVAVSGATERSGSTNDSGQINFPGLQVGNYRLRFSGETVITLERDITLARGQVLQVDVALNPAPKPPPPPPPPPAPAPVVAAPPKPATGPTGQPQSVSVVELLEKEFVGRNPRRESLLSCSGSTRTTMLQVNEPLPERMYSDADVIYYVLGGEGTMKLNGKDSRIATNGFLSVPRGASHSFERRGNRPLVLLAVLGGEPCETAK